MSSNQQPPQTTKPHGQHEHHDHDNFDWGAMGEKIELEGEVLAGFVHDAARKITELFAGGPVHTIIDVGSGPGVGSCILAEAFPQATVTAIDASESLLVRAQARAERMGLTARLLTQVGNLGPGMVSSTSVDLVWASMMLHHVHDQEAALGAIRGSLRVGGWLAIAEFGAPLACIPSTELDAYADVLDRCQAAVWDWLPDQLPDGPAAPGRTHSGSHSGPHSASQAALQAALERTGFSRVEHTTLTVEIPAPLDASARGYVVQSFARLREIVATRLDGADIARLDELLDPNNPRGLPTRADLFVRAGRTLTTAQAVA